MNSVEHRSDTKSRTIEASPARVWAAMSAPDRVARWWGPEGFTNTMHAFELHAGGTWSLTMHGPDGRDYPNESRFTRVVPAQTFEIEHISAPHFVLTVDLVPQGEHTLVRWRQTFDSVETYEKLVAIVSPANEQNLARLDAEVHRDDGEHMPPTR